MRTRRTFTREFKREAACLILDQGFSVLTQRFLHKLGR
jgi:transposase-like protein